MSKQRSPLSPNPNGGGGSSFARWSGSNGAGSSKGGRPCQTYENLEFLYRNPPANSAPSGALMPPPPLPVKCIQRGELLRIKPTIIFIKAVQMIRFKMLQTNSLGLHRSLRSTDFSNGEGSESSTTLVSRDLAFIQPPDTGETQSSVTQYREPRPEWETP